MAWYDESTLWTIRTKIFKTWRRKTAPLSTWSVRLEPACWPTGVGTEGTWLPCHCTGYPRCPALSLRPWQAGGGRRSAGSSRLVILRRLASPPARSGWSGCRAERRCASSRRGAHTSSPPSSWWLKLHMAPAARGQGARASDWGGMGHEGRRRALSLLSHVAAAGAHERT